MNVLFVTRAYSESAGGMERLSFELIEEVKKSRSAAVNVIAYRGPRWRAPLFNVTGLRRVLHASKTAHVIHLGDPLLSFLGWAVRWRTGKPVAVTVHGLDVVWRNALYQWYLSVFFKNFDLYLPISRYVREVLKGMGVQGQIEVVTPGVHDRLFEAGIEKVPEQLYLPALPVATATDAKDSRPADYAARVPLAPSSAAARATPERRVLLSEVVGQDMSDKLVLLTVGRLVKRKGHAWFIEQVLPQLPENVIYAIAGDGPERKNIERAARRAGVLDRVRLLGRVDEAAVRVLYNSVDAFVQPNVAVEGDVEGFGLVLLEAALCERAVFAARLEGMRDAIVDGENGTLLPPGDAAAWVRALQEFVNDKGERRRPQARAYTLAHFSWPVQAAKFVAVLRELTGEGSA